MSTITRAEVAACGLNPRMFAGSQPGDTPPECPPAQRNYLPQRDFVAYHTIENLWLSIILWLEVTQKMY